MGLRLSNAAASAAADAVLALLSGGRLRIYGGDLPGSTPNPIAPVLLAELRFGTPAFAPARNGIAQAMPVAPDASARATGEARWFQAVTTSGFVVLAGTVGMAGADLIVTEALIQRDAQVSVERLTYRQPKDLAA